MKKVLTKIILGLIVICGIIYLLGTLYFEDRYQFNTFINEQDVSKMTESEVKKKFLGEDSLYINIVGKDVNQEMITGEEIGFESKISDNFYEISKSQNKWTWPFSLLRKKEYEVTVKSSFDEDLLKDRLKRTNVVKNENATFPEDAYIKKDNSGFRIIPEKEGTVIDFDSFFEGVKEALNNRQTGYNVSKEGDYLEPEITSTSPELKEELTKLKNATDFKITYRTYKGSTVLTNKQFGDWIEVDDNGLISNVNEDMIKSLVDDIASDCNTVGNTINFTTKNSGVITLKSQTYGWKVNKEKARQMIVDALYNQETTTIDIPFSNEGTNNDGKIGDTYIEVSISEQHLWFYKKGKLVVESDVVTGKPTQDRQTETGLYTIVSRETERYLGTYEVQGYSSFVHYWMPFNGGQGLHDATWRDDSEFGGTTYKTNGSHGCVNLPLDVAKIIYENSHTGYPVIVY